MTFAVDAPETTAVAVVAPETVAAAAVVAPETAVVATVADLVTGDGPAAVAADCCRQSAVAVDLTIAVDWSWVVAVVVDSVSVD